MIPEELEEKLKKVFNTIGFKMSKDGSLSVNEWDFSDDEPEIEDMTNYDEVTFTVHAVFERNKYKKKRVDFLSLMKENFVVMKRNTAKADKKRVILILKLKQAVQNCS